MTKCVLLIPIGRDVGLPTVGTGLQHVLATRGAKVSTLSPFHSDTGVINMVELEDLLSKNAFSEVIERIIARINKLSEQYDVIIIHGLSGRQSSDYAFKVNSKIAQALSAPLIFIAAPGAYSAAALANRVDITVRQYLMEDCQSMGCVINKIFAPNDQYDTVHLPISSSENISPHVKTFKIHLTQTPILAKIAWQAELIAPRLSDVAPHLNTTIVHRGDMEKRRVHSMRLCARGVNNMVSALQPGTLIITAGDRHDIILATAMAALNGTQLAGLLLTGNFQIDPNIYQLCQQAFQTGLPILSVSLDSFRTCQKLQNITLHTPPDDHEKIRLTEKVMGEAMDGDWLNDWLASDIKPHMNQATFRYQLTMPASGEKRRIICPEGDEPRTLAAACECQRRGVAQMILLGDPSKIAVQAKHAGLELPHDIKIIDPQHVQRVYVDELVALRQHKGMNRAIAEEQLHDPLVLGTLLLQRGDADGLVAGARNATANVLRPALQLIKTAPDAKKVSSVFFMCFPNQVMVFGDCAVNPHPDVETLADIAIQSANTAKRFGIEPKVAMISYSTGQSASGEEVARVRAATEWVKAHQPDIIIDGPLQYDAAIIPEVAAKKAPDSPVAGQATVLIFPDLNTGNTTYKAVQRSAHLICIGPMLQGLNKPVNDLSRGASVEDIVYTIALTAKQAQ